MDISQITQLGMGGASLLVLWLFAKAMLSQAEAERKRSEERLDQRDAVMRTLESDIRNKFSSQLQENTNSMLEHAHTMQRVVEVLSGLLHKRGDTLK